MSTRRFKGDCIASWQISQVDWASYFRGDIGGRHRRNHSTLAGRTDYSQCARRITLTSSRLFV